ncbi:MULTISPECIES: metallophosphoesterase family protein [Sorangium]|uniref:Metallophosphoesterase n=1 Tax=Sorangium atrum TaxID=2995308 RepID=A0ABT5BVF3_9BACT|nr:metallophosphoesterase [Sorangium aterium]MDC0678137.1 metallophosphoesterase [Sorangium aterium]
MSAAVAGGNGEPRKRRVAASSDLHCRPEHGARMREIVKAVNAEAELLVLCGDLTDRGHPEEAKVLADALAGLSVPCAAVFGNHDLDRGAGAEIAKLLGDAGVEVLDGDHLILRDDIGVAGVKGFMGGFGSATLQAFGEGPLKAFVQEAVTEALKLEAALSQLDSEKKIVIMHYTPILETTVGENVEIRPFLGTSRLAAPIDLYGADVVFHGHAHHGALEGRMSNGTPVYNVAMPLLRKLTGKSFLLFEV